ncbi:YiaA/YiaB family inner membrane protein [Aquabacterium sp. OR-4]|uniref:YiaA/YiaB family inner membrane protein n=1 Tax=Aquabacterium sp. OR-4 TaxID=2978127 RepID=UPI0021B21D0A|nr:YiaA/YiaB family inner membrane protein [Aquabacterium sp. OR-4]MDT7837733.1 YiaA/YiaB family inner membrane protein [Aquabacterium sp. OR-4]
MSPAPAASAAALPTTRPAATATLQRDTRAWRVQVWVSFALAALLCASGLVWLPGDDLDRAFMVMGYAFCLTSAFVLAKFIRDNAQQPSDTPMWRWVVWGSFALAMGLTGWGLARMGINPVWKAYLGVAWLYLISSVFTLAKTLRDGFEADQADRAQAALRSE